MNNSKETKLAPRLRFPEYKKDGDWQLTPLGKLVDIVTNRNRQNEINRVFTNSAINGLIDQRDFFEKDIATRGNTNTYFIVEQGDYVYNPRISEFAPVGPISRNNLGKGIVSPLYTVFRFFSIQNNFFEFYFKSNYWIQSLKAIGNKGARYDRMSIGISQFLEVNITHPSIHEQQKIAACLSSLDEVITAEHQKLELLKAHKKGLLQNLFPQAGENVPKFRFKEFEDNGEWVMRNESVKILSGVSYKMSEYKLNGVRLVQGANIFNGYYSDTNTLYINDKTDSQRHIVVKKGDILLGLNRPITNNELKVCLYPFDVGYLYQRAGVLKFDNEIFGDFLFQLMCTPLFLAHLKKELVGSDQPYIKSNLFASNIIITPQSFEEQQKIASCLSSLDDLINAQIQKFEALQLYKKGLLQGLFPTVTNEA